MKTVIQYNIVLGIRNEIPMSKAVKILSKQYVAEQIKASLLSGSVLHDNNLFAYKLKPTI